MSRFRGPVRRTRGGFTLHLSDDEIELVRRLLGELDDLLANVVDEPSATDGAEHGAGSPPSDGSPAGHGLPAGIRRLFPVAHPDDPELEAEYQRLMRSELVASRRRSIAEVDRILTGGERLDDAELTSFMQSVNALRLVLGTMLEVDDDPDRPEIRHDAEDSPEYHLYTYLSWLLEWTVGALANRL